MLRHSVHAVSIFVSTSVLLWIEQQAFLSLSKTFLLVLVLLMLDVFSQLDLDILLISMRIFYLINLLMNFV